ncbi:MAG TPA: ATP-binding protein, partial [Chloroflexota bacterium]|nr:ATP-binding protein [Chloroflexota bacterium]
SSSPTPTSQDEVGQLAQAFNHMAAQVSAMLAEQKAFASNASHELRAPLTAIRLRSEALREGSLDAETTHQYIAEIDDEAIRLSHLINDLILLSRFDSGRAEWGQEQIDPARLAHTVCQSLQPITQQKQITVRLELPDELPPVQASQGHLYTVFHNLLENALKYTPPNGQVVWRLAAADKQLHSFLQDTGQGIAPGDLPHLFERFYRGDKAHTRATGGVGLGLSLTHSIVIFYHGRITIDSPGLGQGTTVQLWWPLRQPAR